MLKQILATSALIAITAVSIQSANAATGKFRQLVVEPAGTPADLLLKKTKTATPFILKTGQGILTPPGGEDPSKTGGKVANFIVAPGNGIPTPTGNAGTGNPGGKQVELIVAPGGGIPTPIGGASAGSGNAGQPLQPLVLKTSGGIPTPIKVADSGSDPVQTGGSKAFPLIDNSRSDITAPAGNPGADSGAAAADAGQLPAALPPANPGVQAVAVETGQPAAGGIDTGAVAVAPAAPAAPSIPAIAVANPNDLYTLLTGRGYGVEILKHDQFGNLVFYVTMAGQPNEADLLLVDGTYGKVLEHKRIAAYGYDHPATYAPSYAASYASEDNCDHTAGY
jgi:hypothetical protein